MSSSGSGGFKERDIQFHTRLTLGADPRLVMWRNQQGFYLENALVVCPQCHSRFRPRPGEPERGITYGLGGAGGSDLIGILRGSGRLVAMELKTATGRVSSAQERFLKLVREAGGFGAIIRSDTEAVCAVERAIAGETS